jgi:hypothetical protein
MQSECIKVLFVEQRQPQYADMNRIKKSDCLHYAYLPFSVIRKLSKYVVIKFEYHTVLRAVNR